LPAIGEILFESLMADARQERERLPHAILLALGVALSGSRNQFFLTRVSLGT